jgi:hypothetical protein
VIDKLDIDRLVWKYYCANKIEYWKYEIGEMF